jgi:NADH:ubiquinone oxidoreductase subunit F (NADH-binding)
MPDQTFTAGQILTAAQQSALQTNIGLTFIKSQTIGTAVGSVVVPSAFSTDFDNYLVTVNGGVSSSNQLVALQLGSKTTNYKTQLNFASFSNTASALGSTTATSFTYTLAATTDGLNGYINILSPFLAKNTIVQSAWCSPAEAGTNTGITGDTTSYTAFTLIAGGGANMTGGTISVYGYRKA